MILYKNLTLGRSSLALSTKEFKIIKAERIIVFKYIFKIFEYVSELQPKIHSDTETKNN